eukprot:TRINITY_DN45400_c0_g1_i1.p1 TRINITY_DN45400_c0_g1~~TRINITY_DN45400_c0_g1_i1.p1  ORF type:complete len:828 (+),score=224.64 TRINITY_DN45400_c0_g1_i1:120-2603(+)
MTGPRIVEESTEIHTSTRRSMATSAGDFERVTSSRASMTSNPKIFQTLEELQHKDHETKSRSGSLIREQLQLLGQDVAVVQKEIEMLKRNSDEALRKIRVQFNEKTTEIREEKDLRQQEAERLWAELRSLREELDQERKARSNGHDSLLSQTKAMFGPHKTSLDAVVRSHGELHESTKGVPDELRNICNKLGMLQDALTQEIRDRKAAEAPFLDMLTSHRETTIRELRDHAENHNNNLQTLKESLDRQHAGHAPAIDELRDEIYAVKRELRPHAEQVPALEQKIRALQDQVHPQLQEHRKCLDKLTHDISEVPKHLHLRLDNESKARDAVLEEAEQLVSRIRKEMRDRDTGHGNAIRGLKDQLDKQKADHAPAIEHLQGRVAELHRDLKPQLAQVPVLAQRLDDLEEGAGHQQQHKALTSVTQAVGDLQKKIEPRLLDIHDKLEDEARARRSLEEQLQPQLREHARALERLSADLARVPEKINALTEESGPHRSAIREESRNIVASLRRELAEKGHHDAIGLLKEHAERSAHHGPAIEQLRGQMVELQQELKPHVLNAPALHSKIQELEDTLHPRIEEHRRTLERVAQDHGDSHGKLDRKLNSLAERMDREAAQRTASLEDNDHQIAALKSKVRNMLAEHGESLRKAQEALAQNLRGDLVKQQEAHEDGLQALRENLGSDRKALEARVDQLSLSLSDLDRKASGDRLDDGTRRALAKLEDLSSQVQELKQGLDAGLARERSCREDSIASLEENVSALETLCREVGDLFLNTGIRRKVGLKGFRRDTRQSIRSSLPAFEESSTGLADDKVPEFVSPKSTCSSPDSSER